MYIGLSIILLWVTIFTIDNFLEHRLGFRYISWKFQKEIVLKPFYFRWQNSKLGNKTFYDYNFNLKSKKYSHWFNCGVFATVILCVYGYSLFIPPVFQLFRENNVLELFESVRNSNTGSDENAFNKAKQQQSEQMSNDFSLSIGLPGYNIPWSHTILVFLALIIAGLIHEFGHALAAALEKISINGAGAFLTFIFPGAFVNISSIELSNCDLLPRMRILCAGVWHNLFLCVLMVSMVKYFLPVFFKLGYYRGICVIDMPRVLRGGIIPGDSILQINGCYTADYNLDEFEACLLREEANNYGSCVDNKNITTGHYTANLEMTNVKQYNSLISARTVDQTQDPENPKNLPIDDLTNPSQNLNLEIVNIGSYISCDVCNHDSHTLCYSEYSSSKNSDSSSRKKSKANDDDNSLKICLNVRQTLISNKCNTNKECHESSTCMKLNHAKNQRLISIVIGNKKPHDQEVDEAVSGRESKKSSKEEYTPLLYFGNIKNFLNEMILTNYCSRIPVLLPTFLPDLLIMLFKYLFSISGGLMILNSMPCYGLDGYLVLEHLLESMYGINERIRKMFLIVVTSLTTFLVGLNLLIGIVMTS